MAKQVHAARLAGVLLLLSCSDDTAGRPRVESGLPANEKLSRLDTGDAQQLCMSLADSFNNVLPKSERKRISCTILALPLAVTKSSTGEVHGDVDKCKQAVNRCLNGEKISDEPPAFEVDESFIEDEQCSEAQAGAKLKGCEASVAEFEDCASAILGVLADKFALIDCESLRDPEALNDSLSTGLDVGSQPQCKALDTKCPELDFGSPDSEASGGD